LFTNLIDESEVHSGPGLVDRNPLLRFDLQIFYQCAFCHDWIIFLFVEYFHRREISDQPLPDYHTRSTWQEECFDIKVNNLHWSNVRFDPSFLPGKAPLSAGQLLAWYGDGTSAPRDAS